MGKGRHRVLLTRMAARMRMRGRCIKAPQGFDQVHSCVQKNIENYGLCHSPCVCAASD